MTSKPRHSLSNIDRDAKTATCSVCGDVGIYVRKPPQRPLCRVQISNYQKQWRSTPEGKEKVRGYNDKIVQSFGRGQPHHGLTAGAARAMREATPCEICGSDYRKAVDHCHTTGKIRGVLCFYCNTALGKFNDDPEILQRAIDYLRR